MGKSKGDFGAMSDKKMKKQIVIVALISVFSIVGLIWCLTPVKLMEFSSSDGSITVVISRPKVFGPFADSDYNIKIKKKGGLFDKTLLSESFEYDDFHLGQLDDSRVKIQWYENHVEVLIGITKHNEGWHSFKAEF